MLLWIALAIWLSMKSSPCSSNDPSINDLMRTGFVRHLKVAAATALVRVAWNEFAFPMKAGAPNQSIRTCPAPAAFHASAIVSSGRGPCRNSFCAANDPGAGWFGSAKRMAGGGKCFVNEGVVNGNRAVVYVW